MKFTSPMVSKANQDDLDGGTFKPPFDTAVKKHRETLRRVIDGEKPFGAVTGSREELRSMRHRAIAAGLLTSAVEEGLWEGQYRLTFSVQGRLSDHFDMDALAEVYERNGLHSVARDIRTYADSAFEHYNGSDNWDISDTTQPWETGLILGYPVANTLRRCYGVRRPKGC